MADRNLGLGEIGAAFKAFQEGRMDEVDLLIKKHEAITSSQISAADIGLRTSQQQLQERRFGEMEKPYYGALTEQTEVGTAGAAESFRFQIRLLSGAVSATIDLTTPGAILV